LNIEKAVDSGDIIKVVLIEELCKLYGSDFIIDALLNFEPVNRFKNWRYMNEFGSFRDS